MGIFGLGRIGKEVDRLAKAFGMIVIYNKRTPLSAKEEAELQLTYCDFDQLLSQADVISLHAPATAETQGLFNAAAFEKMKPTAFLINTARGSLVNQADLVTALKTGQIAGAGLDVFENEPQVPVDLIDLDNVELTPHAGSATLEDRILLAKEAADNLILYFRDGILRNHINP